MLYKANRQNAFETHLQAFILQNFAHKFEFPKRFLGSNEFLGVGMQRIDILTMQESNNNIHFKIIELKDEQPTANIVDYQLNWYIKWLFDYIIPNYDRKAVEITPCIVAAKTNDMD